MNYEKARAMLLKMIRKIPAENRIKKGIFCGGNALSKDDVIWHIENDTEIGKYHVGMYLNLRKFRRKEIRYYFIWGVSIGTIVIFFALLLHHIYSLVLFIS